MFTDEKKIGGTETKFAQMLGEIRVLSSDLKGEMGKITTRLDSVERSTTGIKATIIVTALAGIAVIVAVVVGFLAYGGQWFNFPSTTKPQVVSVMRACARQGI